MLVTNKAQENSSDTPLEPTVSAAPYGSAAILPISWSYIKVSVHTKLFYMSMFDCIIVIVFS